MIWLYKEASSIHNANLAYPFWITFSSEILPQPAWPPKARMIILQISYRRYLRRGQGRKINQQQKCHNLGKYANYLEVSFRFNLINNISSNFLICWILKYTHGLPSQYTLLMTQVIAMRPKFDRSLCMQPND